MNLRDRLTGGELLELPATLMPGRYRLLEPLVVNGHGELKVGDLLLDDGSGAIRINATVCQVESISQSDVEQTDTELSAEAIIAIAGKLAPGNNARVSPVLPAEMAAQCELDELERILAVVLREGHLHAISDQPRRNLRYDDLVAPVARARRLATSALSHLASHSDCWQQRTLSGIQPRKILARFSDDDYAIYENRLYKRLLDRLDRHLAKRLARVRGVNSRLKKAIDFQQSENVHFRLWQDICKLWGESYEANATGAQLEAGRQAVADLESQLHTIRSLKQRGLYTLVPAASAVPGQVHRTNILNHDPHYRWLPPLWEKLKEERDEKQLSPEDRLLRHQQLQHAYSDYVGLVLRRALERYGAQNVEGSLSFNWGGALFVVEQKEHDWLVLEAGGARLRFVPIAWFGTAIGDANLVGAGHVVCWPGTATSVASSQQLAISPLDLYVVEKMGRLIDEWLLRHVLEGYGRDLGPLPTPVKLLADEWHDQFENVSLTHAKLVAPLDESQTSDLKNTLQTSANSHVDTDVTSAIEQVAVLSQLCGHVARFVPSPHQEFYCQCSTCQATWGIKASGKKRLFSMRPKGAINLSLSEGFSWAGRDWLDINLNGFSARKE